MKIRTIVKNLSFFVRFKNNFWVLEGDLVYRCKTCERHATAVLCKECFDMSEHKNHDFKVKSNYGP